MRTEKTISSKTAYCEPLLSCLEEFQQENIICTSDPSEVGLDGYGNEDFNW